MPIVNYVREHTRFIEYASDEKLSSSERLLWYALMHIMNQRAQGNVWPDDFVHIGNDRLLSLSTMKFDTLAKARNKLKQRGLIEFEPGEKNKKNPAYRMIYFYPAPIPNSYPINSDNMGYNMGDNVGGNMGYNMGDNVGGNTGDIRINNTQEPIRYPNQEREEDDETDNIRFLRARESAKRAWIRAFGREPNQSILNELTDQGINTYEYDEEVICEAIRMAGLRGASDPLAYVIELFSDWHFHGAYTMNDIKKYLVFQRHRSL